MFDFNMSNSHRSMKTRLNVCFKHLFVRLFALSLTTYIMRLLEEFQKISLNESFSNYNATNYIVVTYALYVCMCIYITRNSVNPARVQVSSFQDGES